MLTVFCESVDEAGFGMIAIQRQHGAAGHVLPLTAIVAQLPTDEPTLILDAVALCFRQFLIFLHGLCRADGLFQPHAELVKCGRFVRPGLGKATIAICNR